MSLRSLIKGPSDKESDWQAIVQLTVKCFDPVKKHNAERQQLKPALKIFADRPACPPGAGGTNRGPAQRIAVPPARAVHAPPLPQTWPAETASRHSGRSDGGHGFTRREHGPLGRPEEMTAGLAGQTRTEATAAEARRAVCPVLPQTRRCGRVPPRLPRPRAAFP